MLLIELKTPIDKAFDRIKAKYGTWLPFGGKYLEAFRAFLQMNLAAIRAQWEAAAAGGDVHKLIDFLIDFSRGNLPLPWYAKLLAGVYLEGLRVWLHRNADVLRDQVGGLRPADEPTWPAA